MMKLEIERKFLLKSIPIENPNIIYYIEQYYLKNQSGIWERVRKYQTVSTFKDIYNYLIIENSESYLHTIKKSVSKGISSEEERILSFVEYDEFKQNCLKNNESRFINKFRFVYEISDGLKWEVDIFNNGYHLIIGEIEIPRKNYQIIIPDYIKDVILMEVTGIKEFNNRNLSLILSDINKYKKK